MEIDAWFWEREARVPEDCAALLIAAPDTPFPPVQLEAIRDWIDRGGRVVLAPAVDDDALERSDVPELLAHIGLEARHGLVMNEGRDSLGRPSLEPELVVLVPVVPSGMQAHPITNPLRDAGRRIFFSRVHPIVVRSQPVAPRVGTSFVLLESGVSWLDVPPVDYRPDANRDEVGKFPLCVVTRFSADSGADPAVEAGGTTGSEGGLERLESRLVTLGSASVLANQHLDYNADFVRNVFRWVTSREYRLGISPRDPDHRRLPLGQAESVGRVSRVALWWLPAACFVLGLITAFVRSRGGPAPPTEARRQSTGGFGA
jgi:hypothetical protein